MNLGTHKKVPVDLKMPSKTSKNYLIVISNP
jgi:hypothetical protein